MGSRDAACGVHVYFFAECVCVLCVPDRVYAFQSRGEYVHGQLAGLSSG